MCFCIIFSLATLEKTRFSAFAKPCNILSLATLKAILRVLQLLLHHLLIGNPENTRLWVFSCIPPSKLVVFCKNSCLPCVCHSSQYCFSSADIRGALINNHAVKLKFDEKCILVLPCEDTSCAESQWHSRPQYWRHLIMNALIQTLTSRGEKTDE